VYNISHFQVLIIAHRLEMILMADRIVLLEGSEVREMTRSAFLSRDGHFSQPDALSPELGEI
jgi:putative ABC transport system ATP-binding protein